MNNLTRVHQSSLILRKESGKKEGKKISFFKSQNFEKEEEVLPKNAILLVVPSEKISLQRELSSPPCLRFQGGSLSVRYTAAGAGAGQDRTCYSIIGAGYSRIQLHKI